MTDEEYVRAQWEPDAKVPCLPHVVIVLNDPYWLAPHADDDGYEAQCWSAAKAFTEDRERQIAEVEEEIAWLEQRLKSAVVIGHCENALEPDASILNRILAVEQHRLKALRQGMVAK